MADIKNQNSEIIIFKTADEKVSVNVVMENETVWLTQNQMADLFGKAKSTINEHIKNIYSEKELAESETMHKFGISEFQQKAPNYYNLDVIISVGYRVKSLRGTEFRKWATARLKEYIIKGFTMDDERLKGTGGGNYWKELLDRIRDIRSSEKVLYRQVLDLYATSIDYAPKSEESKIFFATVQNKLHYAVNKQTAAEIIHDRVNAEKEFTGLTTFSGEIPVKKDIAIAKNYLKEEELQRFNRLVSAFFDLAELKAMDHEEMKMQNWIDELDTFTTSYGKGTLQNAGKISHNKAIQKAETEYKKYQVKTLSPVEKEYLENMKNIEKTILNNNEK
ncbi:MAG: virulence RhuM family protein [Bacteroidota bacterium]|nr:virulence RhuM family protein [Bacteroidota bacterium]